MHQHLPSPAARWHLSRLTPGALPRKVTRPVSVLVLIAWVATMAVLVHRSYLQASVNLATDLSRYGAAAQWHGVYYRGAKIGFTVRQAAPLDSGDGGYRFEEDGQLEMTRLGATTRRAFGPRWRWTTRSPCAHSSSRLTPAPVRSRSRAGSKDRSKDTSQARHSARAATRSTERLRAPPREPRPSWGRPPTRGALSSN